MQRGRPKPYIHKNTHVGEGYGSIVDLVDVSYESPLSRVSSHSILTAQYSASRPSTLNKAMSYGTTAYLKFHLLSHRPSFLHCLISLSLLVGLVLWAGGWIGLLRVIIYLMAG